jgi:hypothetical protein
MEGRAEVSLSLVALVPTAGEHFEIIGAPCTLKGVVSSMPDFLRGWTRLLHIILWGEILWLADSP